MQFQFQCESTIEKYVADGTNFNFPTMKRCRNPKCLIHRPPKKHGFYWRYYIGPKGLYRIPIRRYYCTHCGVTFSFLPSFCFSFYQYCSTVISEILVERFIRARSYASILGTIKQSYPDLDICLSHIKLYTKRFLVNLQTIEIVLRNTDGVSISLTKESGHKNRARKILNVVLAEWETIQTLAKVFLEQCHRSFLSPKSNIVSV